MTNDKLKIKNERFSILGIPVDSVSLEEVTDVVEKKLTPGNIRPFFISTINASFIVKAQNDTDFRKILQKETDLNTCDGISIQLAGEYLKTIRGSNFIKNLLLGLKVGIFEHILQNKEFTVFPNRVTGVSITKNILEFSDAQQLNILIVNRPDGLTSKQEIINFLKLKYPKIIVQFIEIKDSKYKLEDNLVCDVLFCLLGEGKQEFFIHNNKDKIKYSVAIGVGSTFDVLTGNIKSIPSFIKARGFEWLFRLICHPQRIKKIIISVCYFPYLVYMSSLKND